MMTKIASAAAVLAIAGSAMAQGLPWNLRGTVNFADSELITGSLGIAPTTSFYNDALGGANGGPNPAFFAVFPALEFDSYWALGSGPSSVANGQAPAYAGSGAPITVSSSLAENGAGFGTPGVGQDSTLKEVNGVLGHAIFLARLTTLGSGSGLTASNGEAAFGQIGMFNGALGQNVQLTLNGAGASGPGIGEGGAIVQQTYWLVSEVQEVEFGGNVYTVHDLYVTTAIPTPGAVALFGLAGLAAARRRRA